jgi:hypothetical protein
MAESVKTAFVGNPGMIAEGLSELSQAEGSLRSQHKQNWRRMSTNHYFRSVNFMKRTHEKCLLVDQRQKFVIFFGQAFKFLLEWEQSSQIRLKYIWSAVKHDSSRDI